MFSLLIPVFNEERAIEDTIRRAHRTLSTAGEEFEILVIDDGSTDGTKEILHSLELPGLHVHRRPQNRGYGASLSYGIRHSHGDCIGITDADGTYPIEDFPRLLGHLREEEADMVVGARTGKDVRIPFMRRPAKWIVNALANFLTGIRIPDLNSGMRIFRRELAERFLHLYPQRFSFTITITLASLTNHYEVRYLPISYAKRVGHSTLSSGLNGLKNFGLFLHLIIRMVTLFRPLRFFIWPSLFLFTGGIVLGAYTLWQKANISDSGVLLLVTGLQIGLFGLLAEAIVRSRN